MIYHFDTLLLSVSHPFAILLGSLEGKILQGIIPNKFSAYFPHSRESCRYKRINLCLEESFQSKDLSFWELYAIPLLSVCYPLAIPYFCHPFAVHSRCSTLHNNFSFISIGLVQNSFKLPDEVLC